MSYRLAVGLRAGIEDVQGRWTAAAIRKELGLEVEQVRMIRIYLLEGLEEHQVQTALRLGLIHDPVLHEAPLSPLDRDFDWILEVGFKPGVTDNEGRVAREALVNGLGLDADSPCRVYTSIQYCLRGTLPATEVGRIATDFLANALIERYHFKDKDTWREQPGFSAEVPRVTGGASDRVETIQLSGLSDQALEALSRDRVLALSLSELRHIQAYYARPATREARQEKGLPAEPTDAELEVLAQTWSEHCKHKIFNARIRYEDRERGVFERVDSLFKTCIQDPTRRLRQRMGAKDFCLSVFKDNAGVLRFDEDYSVCIKVETHNSPSALDPYGGALTGIVGVNRDPMGTGLGANLICNTDVFCFASPFYRDPLPPRLLHPSRVLEGVRRGVEHGGNQSGIPTVNGGLVFDSRFLGKPLVFCGTVGMMPARIQGRPSHEKKAVPGDRVLMVGGRVGKDGIHGATFSSEALHAGSPATAVQIGDPITQRKMYDFLMRARDEGLYNAITDNGAGGLSSSVGEMAEDTGGCELDLARVPLKYDGLLPWEILLSEAQERMTVAVPEARLDRFLHLARAMDVEASCLGRFTESGFFRVAYGETRVAELEMDFMHHGLPQMELEAIWEQPVSPPFAPEPLDASEHRGLLRRVLGRLNICSRESIIRQYDHEVQGGSVIKPLVGVGHDGPADAAVIRPILDRERGLVISNGICPKFSDLDTYWMMANAVDEAIRNNVAAGGDLRHMAGIDNFCWCDPVYSEKTPDGRYKLARLVRANRALADFCLGYGVPCISGKDSMKNDYSMGDITISIPPTVLFSVISVIPEVVRCMSSDMKKPGDRIYLLGLTREELGGSEFAAEMGASGGQVPQVDLLSARERYLRVHQGIVSGWINACHDLSDGGLGVALAEMCIGGQLGARIDLDSVPVLPGGMGMESVLYSESSGRLLVTVPAQNEAAFRSLWAGQTCAFLGEVLRDQVLSFYHQDRLFFSDTLAELRQAWERTLDF